MVFAFAALAHHFAQLDVAKLGRQYQAYELPMPPPGSKPVWLTYPPKVMQAAPDLQKPGMAWGLLTWRIPTQEGDRYFMALSSVDSVSLGGLVESSVPTKPMDLADPKAAVFTAAQLDLLGYGSLAKRLVHDSAADRSTPPSMELQNRAFKYWSNVAWTQPAKRGKLLSLLTRFPSLDGIALTKGQQLFLSDLRLTMTPDKPTTQVDRDLDGLLFARDELTSNCWIPLVDPDPIQKKLWLEGFDAVPDLIRHVDDRRLTTMLNGSDAIEPLWMDSHCVTLGAQATMFLDLLSGQFFNTRTQAEAWWNGVKDNSEKAYLERQLANVKSDESLSVNAKYWAAIYEAKFDRRSPEVIEIKSVGLR